MKLKNTLINSIDKYLEDKFHHNGNKSMLKSKIKLKIYELLGAKFFQKVVFKVEEIKYIILNKIFPNSHIFLESIMDKVYISKQKNLHYEDPAARREHIKEKLKYRKELATSQNRNYHYNKDCPSECIEYLKSNRSIHIRGLRNNLITILLIFLISCVLITISPMLIITLYSLEVLSIIINFECINLQNYNLERLENERTLKVLKKRENERIEADIKKYRGCSKVVAARLMSDISIPTTEEISSEIKNVNDAQELRVMASRRLNRLKKINEEKILRRK